MCIPHYIVMLNLQKLSEMEIFASQHCTKVTYRKGKSREQLKKLLVTNKMKQMRRYSGKNTGVSYVTVKIVFYQTL